jgi:hypothetical protein
MRLHDLNGALQKAISRRTRGGFAQRSRGKAIALRRGFAQSDVGIARPDWANRVEEPGFVYATRTNELVWETRDSRAWSSHPEYLGGTILSEMRDELFNF